MGIPSLVEQILLVKDVTIEMYCWTLRTLLSSTEINTVFLVTLLSHLGTPSRPFLLANTITSPRLVSLLSKRYRRARGSKTPSLPCQNSQKQKLRLVPNPRLPRLTIPMNAMMLSSTAKTKTSLSSRPIIRRHSSLCQR